MAKREMKANKIETPEVVEEVTMETPAEEPKVVEEAITPTLIGIVRNCSRLNVRSEADRNAKILCVINEGDEVELIEDGSTNEFYRVEVNKPKKGVVKGYCMRRYIIIKK